MSYQRIVLDEFGGPEKLRVVTESQLLQPIVAGRYALAQAAEVHRRIEAAEIAGRAVLICNEAPAVRQRGIA